MNTPETESNQTIATSIAVTVNGAPQRVPAGLKIDQLLEHLAISPDKVAIELNREIVRRPSWSSTAVGEGAQIEIVQFVGGG